MGIYDLEISITSETTLEEKYYLSELNIYGSSRVGMEKQHTLIADRSFEESFSSAGYVDLSDETNVTNYFSPTHEPDGINGLYTDTRRNRFFELSNHLGNVLAVVNDIKYPVTSGTTVDYFEVALVSVSDYSPFGVQLDGRTFESSSYRYGFNGMESDDEVKGEGN